MDIPLVPNGEKGNIQIAIYKTIQVDVDVDSSDCGDYGGDAHDDVQAKRPLSGAQP